MKYFLNAIVVPKPQNTELYGNEREIYFFYTYAEESFIKLKSFEVMAQTLCIRVNIDKLLFLFSLF